MSRIIKKSTEFFHHGFHVVIGIATAFIIANSLADSSEVSTKSIVYAGLIFSLLPDFEHFIYYFTYGSKSDYSIAIKKLLRGLHFWEYCKFAAKNHKTNTGLFFHNIITPIICLIIGGIALIKSYDYAAIAFGVVASHYLFDIAEDKLLLGKINPNWFLHFNQNNSKK